MLAVRPLAEKEDVMDFETITITVIVGLLTDTALGVVEMAATR